MDSEPDYLTLLENVERNELVDALNAALRGEASNEDERRVVLEYLARKRFIDLELSQPNYPKHGLPIINIVGATLTAAGGQLLDWLEPHERSSAAGTVDEPPPSEETP